MEPVLKSFDSFNLPVVIFFILLALVFFVTYWIKLQNKLKHNLSGLADRFNIILEAAPNPKIIVNKRGEIVLVNNQAKVLFGYNRKELIGQPIEMLIPDRFRSKHSGYRKEFFSNPETRTMGAGRDLFGLKKDGSEVPVEIGLSAIRTPGDIYVLASIIDITWRKQIEENLKKRLEDIEEQNRSITETSTDAFISIDGDSKVLNWNKQAEKTFGWLKTEAIGKNLSDLIMPEKYREAHKRGIAHFLKSGEGPVLNKRIGITALRRDRIEFPVELTIWPVKQQDGYVFNSFMHDISERKQFEERIKYLAKREALGEFVAATAHEINNPIGIIAGNAKYLKEILKNEDGSGDKKLDLKEVIEGLESIYKNCIRCANTTKQLLAYSRESKLSLKSEMDLNDCISGVIDFVRNQFQQSKIFIETEFGKISKINGNREALEQAIINILLNSKQSMPDGGRLTIRTFKSGGGKVTCEIKDTGCGINEKDLEHVLEPFFTTKQEGTGLGLSVCYNIIKDHEGELKIESVVGKGTNILIQLPGIQ